MALTKASRMLARMRTRTHTHTHTHLRFQIFSEFKTNGYKLVLPSGGPSGKYTKY